MMTDVQYVSLGMSLVYLKPDRPTYMQLTSRLMLFGMALPINHCVSIQNLSHNLEIWKR